MPIREQPVDLESRIQQLQERYHSEFPATAPRFHPIFSNDGRAWENARVAGYDIGVTRDWVRQAVSKGKTTRGITLSRESFDDAKRKHLFNIEHRRLNHARQPAAQATLQ